MMKFVLTISLVLFASCGLKPLPPIPPVGTDSCDTVCVCSDDGECGWVFICK